MSFYGESETDLLKLQDVYEFFDYNQVKGDVRKFGLQTLSRWLMAVDPEMWVIDNLIQDDDLLKLFVYLSSKEAEDVIEQNEILVLDIQKRMFTHENYDDLLSRLLVKNGGLVLKNAYSFLHRGLDLLDLIQEGFIGLIETTVRFDIHKGAAFSNYATYWIRKEMGRAVSDTARLICVPENQLTTLNKVRRAWNVLVQRNGKNPTPEEVAKEVESLSVEQVSDTKYAEERTLNPLDDDGVIFGANGLKSLRSLNEIIGDGEETVEQKGDRFMRAKVLRRRIL